MSRIHTALKASSKKDNYSPVPKKEPLSSLDEKLISAGVSREILAEAHSDLVRNSSGFFDHLVRKKAIGEIHLLKTLAEHFGLSFRSELPM
ncbi:MAG: hypothetical protein ABSF20_05615, partial [Smithella sp.]